MDELHGEILGRGQVEVGHGQQLMRVDVDLWALTERPVERQRPLARGHASTVAGSGIDQVAGNRDARSIGRILASLLSDAVTYSPSGGQIIISVEQDGQEGIVNLTLAGGISRPASGGSRSFPGPNSHSRPVSGLQIMPGWGGARRPRSEADSARQFHSGAIAEI